MTMPGTAAADRTMNEQQTRKPVARCLFGKPNPDDLEKMEKAVAEEQQERMRIKYGLDLAQLAQHDFDVLIVPLPDKSRPESNAESTSAGDTGEDMMDTSQPPAGPQENSTPL